jgi:MFS transporter, YNFM family, putative membrane transport protein
VPQLVFWRFVQGLLLPPIFTVSVAYVGDEWPPREVPRVAGLFIAGSSVGGFCGRFVTGAVADLAGWRASFAAAAAITLIAAAIVTLTLPRESCFVRSGGFLASVRQMLGHLRNPRLLAIYAVGFGVLFNFIGAFTYVSFHLAGPPYFFSSTLLGAIFVTYLAGTLIVPWIGRVIALVGRRRFILAVIALWVLGALLLLAPLVSIILAGLTICAICGLICQAVSTGAVVTTAKDGRSSAAGLYASTFYIGGSVGAYLIGLVWHAAEWDGCVAVLVAMLAIMATIVAVAWERS